MTISTNNSNNQPSSNLHLSEQARLIEKAFANIFKKDETQISKLLHFISVRGIFLLFSGGKSERGVKIYPPNL